MDEHPIRYVQSWGLKDPPDRQSVVKAYRKKAQRLHPDRAGNTPQANEAFIQLRQQYLLLLKYSSSPDSFTAPKPDTPDPSAKDSFTEPVRPRPTQTQPVSYHQAWSVPPGNITLRHSWPLPMVWTGAVLPIHYTRGFPCGCQNGCHVCRGTLMRFERVSIQVSIPPISSPTTKVRLLGMGHRGDGGTVGLAILELPWTRMGKWQWGEGFIYRNVDISKLAPWAYCRSPSGSWTRLPTQHPCPEWVSQGGLHAKVKFRFNRPLAARLQFLSAWRWAWSQPLSMRDRIKLGYTSVSQCW